ncbi:MAG TPA: ABC transporter ATP-binding protein, partial [Verrucomicrobiae bacterium]|nr:ABC transporter ATP-binding protein [Verrucomicrobiae bacterium]
MNATTVRVEALTRNFGDFVAVDAISFEIHAGEIWGFLGPNGSGKSTTIRMLCGVLAPSKGTAEVLGFDVARDPEAVKLRIGYMSQGSTLWNDLTVEEHLRFYAGLFGFYGRDAADAVKTWMERTALTERRAELAGSLPGGYRKRLALACTLLHRPQMLFLDEPTSGVDPLSRREFWDLIAELAEEGITTMVTTHYLDEAEHCDRLALMYGGRILARGTPESLKRGASGVTVEILSPENARVLELLDEAAFVRSASLYGSSLHVTLADEQGIAELEGFLAQRGFA